MCVKRTITGLAYSTDFAGLWHLTYEVSPTSLCTCSYLSDILYEGSQRSRTIYIEYNIVDTDVTESVDAACVSILIKKNPQK